MNGRPSELTGIKELPDKDRAGWLGSPAQCR